MFGKEVISKGSKEGVMKTYTRLGGGSSKVPRVVGSETKTNTEVGATKGTSFDKVALEDALAEYKASSHTRARARRKHLH